MEKYNDNLSESLVDWNHEGKLSSAWEVRQFVRGVSHPKLTPCLTFGNQLKPMIQLFIIVTIVPLLLILPGWVSYAGTEESSSSPGGFQTRGALYAL